MKMTKNNVRELLKDKNYNEALAFAAQRVMKFKTEIGQDAERERIYYKWIEWAYEFEEDDFENDYSTNVMRIDSALFAAIN